MKNKCASIYVAILAATLYGISSPLSKLLLVEIPGTLIAALLYLGAGLGMLAINLIVSIRKKEPTEEKISKYDAPYILGMVLLDIAAPISLMIGLNMTTSANAALINNFEIVATSLMALLIYKEAIGKRLWIGISFITLASILLSFEDLSSFSFSLGSVFVLLACLFWGFENNCTRMLSLKNPLQIVVVKGFGSGFGSLIIALSLKQYSANTLYILLALSLGFIAYGLSIYFYILAQRELGAARTSAYYAVAPFIGVLLSVLIFDQPIALSFILALLLMIVGVYFSGAERHKHLHTHNEIMHAHRHHHQDNHHNHTHDDGLCHNTEHSHFHVHEKTEHSHAHTPDMHHNHAH